MTMFDAFMRLNNTNGAIYLPYSIAGEVTQEEKKLIEDAFKPYVPERVDAMFINWQIMKFPDGTFMARMATWRNEWYTPTAEDLADKITTYYEQFKNL